MTPGSEGGRPPMGPAEAQRLEDEAQDRIAGRIGQKILDTPLDEARTLALALQPPTAREALVDELRERALDGVACAVCGSPTSGPVIRTAKGSSGLWQALARARAKLLPIKRDRTAHIEGRDGRQGYEYAYATLDAVLAAVVPALSSEGLALAQPIWKNPDGQTVVSTVLVHGDSGQHVRADMAVPPPDASAREPLKKLGSAITYARRYTLTSLIVVASEEDDDGHRGDAASGRGKQAEGAETTDAEREGKRIRGKCAGRLKAAFGEGEPWKDAQKIEVIRRITGKAWAQLHTMGNVDLSRLLAERLELTIQDVKEGVAPRAWPTTPPPAAAPAPMAAPAEREPGQED